MNRRQTLLSLAIAAVAPKAFASGGVIPPAAPAPALDLGAGKDMTYLVTVALAPGWPLAGAKASNGERPIGYVLDCVELPRDLPPPPPSGASFTLSLPLGPDMIKEGDLIRFARSGPK